MSNDTSKNIIFTKRVLFVGIPDMAYVCLDGLKITGVNIVGVIGPKKSHGTYNDFKNFVGRLGLNFIEYDKLDDAAFIDEIKDLNADLAVVCSFNYKIPKVLLDSVKGGFINVHPSLLPKYRGANPYSAVIINNEKETGVTLHFMDEGFDTGDIIAQKTLPLTEKETMGTIFNRLNVLAFEMLFEALKTHETSELSRLKQPEGEFVLGNAVEGMELFINYEKSAEDIVRFVRGLNPFLVATTNFRRNFIKIFAAEVAEVNKINEKLSENQSPGTIVNVEEEKFYVATGCGLICPTVIQFGSFFIGTAKDFIQIVNPKVGEEFL